MEFLKTLELVALSKAARSSQGGDLILKSSLASTKKICAKYSIPFINVDVTIPYVERRTLLDKIARDHGLTSILDMDTIGKKTRTERAETNTNEKYAAKSPNDGYVLIKSQVNVLRHINNPNWTCIRVNHNEINLDSIQRVIVVENLQAFDQILQSTNEINDLDLVLYRGNGVSVKSVTEFLTKLEGTNIQVIAWCDFDPEGIKIAATMPAVSQLIVPKLAEPELMEELGKINQPDLFLKQYRVISFVEKIQKQCGSEELSHLLKRKLAISQEHQIAHKLKLHVINLK
ncbi:DUF2399 domain-containing protein [Psychrosphaera sp. F3M07]|uniref:DUF7281 domain-containing protein n=1 Tax=Psychrosphaera sp. F3M07 TaxID=2841560 RepID=UPI001C09AC8C|nr:DUF2399 domain-containing protein [Psychrosphaera sp. F3M07]MBU2918090.1 DUF2399 domain-containing protein [Psychrosphaera sp. F3M07]